MTGSQWPVSRFAALFPKELPVNILQDVAVGRQRHDGGRADKISIYYIGLPSLPLKSTDRQ
jgi:hypothetical protein